MSHGITSNFFVHTLLRARDWQHRHQLDQVCQWWRRGGRGVLALVGMGGAGKTAIVERLLRVLPGGLPEDPDVPKDPTLPAPHSVFVFSFYDAPNPEAFFEALEQIIQTTKTAAVLFGPSGLGPWEEPEMRACLAEFVKRKSPVIPVLLPGAPRQPDLPLFLQAFAWVDLRDGLSDDGLDRLAWGITGRKPASVQTQAGAAPRAPVNTQSSSGALATWKEKLEYLQQQEAITADAAQKFALKKQIEEVQQKIRELGGSTQPSPAGIAFIRSSALTSADLP